MEQEKQLKEEIKFWLTYIKDWKDSHYGPAPERALTLLDTARLKLKNHYLEEEKVKSRQGENRLLH